MGLKVRGLDGLDVRLQQVGERVVRRARERMKREGRKILELARDYAPRDKGNLEDALDLQYLYDGPSRRLNIEIGVYGDGKLSDYAVEMHEALQPYGAGPYNLGPGSQEKATGGKDVGGRYLERAARDRSGEVEREVTLEVRKGWRL